MEDILLKVGVAVVSSIATVLAAGWAGFWAYLRSRDAGRDNTTKLLMGLAHDKIIFLGLRYVDRGWISKDEFEDFQKYLYEPYCVLGGNGMAERIMHMVERLPIRSTHVLDNMPIRRTDPTADPSNEMYQLLSEYEGKERRNNA